MHIAPDLLPDEIAPQQIRIAEHANAFNWQNHVVLPKHTSQTNQMRLETAGWLDASYHILRLDLPRAEGALVILNFAILHFLITNFHGFGALLLRSDFAVSDRHVERRHQFAGILAAKILVEPTNRQGKSTPRTHMEHRRKNRESVIEWFLPRLPRG